MHQAKLSAGLQASELKSNMIQKFSDLATRKINNFAVRMSEFLLYVWPNCKIFWLTLYTYTDRIFCRFLFNYFIST